MKEIAPRTLVLHCIAFVLCCVCTCMCILLGYCEASNHTVMRIRLWPARRVGRKRFPLTRKCKRQSWSLLVTTDVTTNSATYGDWMPSCSLRGGAGGSAATRRRRNESALIHAPQRILSEFSSDDDSETGTMPAANPPSRKTAYRHDTRDDDGDDESELLSSLGTLVNRYATTRGRPQIPLVEQLRQLLDRFTRSDATRRVHFRDDNEIQTPVSDDENAKSSGKGAKTHARGKGKSIVQHDDSKTNSKLMVKPCSLGMAKPKQVISLRHCNNPARAESSVSHSLVARGKEHRYNGSPNFQMKHHTLTSFVPTHNGSWTKPSTGCTPWKWIITYSWGKKSMTVRKVGTAWSTSWVEPGIACVLSDMNKDLLLSETCNRQDTRMGYGQWLLIRVWSWKICNHHSQMAKTQNNHTGPMEFLRLLMDYWKR